MKQPKYKIVDSIAAVPAQTQTISGELDQIRKLIDANKKLDAWNAAKALHGKHPDHPIANYGMALAIYNAGQKSAALPYAEAAVKKAPDNALYHLFLGKLYVDLEMLEFAPAVLEKAAALDKTMFQAPLDHGGVLFWIESRRKSASVLSRGPSTGSQRGNQPAQI